MGYILEKLSPRQFEVLAINFVSSIKPNDSWQLTKSVADFNRDFEAQVSGRYVWGEAKHTEKAITMVNKSRWDPTLLSAVLKNNVDEIYLVTCGNIPLQYIVRAQHFKDNRINGIKYINRAILDNWLENKPKNLNNYGVKEFDINVEMKRIEDRNYPHTNFKTNIIVNCFNLVNNDRLQPVKKAYTNTYYEILISYYLSNNDTLYVDLPTNFRFVEVLKENLSYEYDKSDNIEYISSKQIGVDCISGYGQIVIRGLFENSIADTVFRAESSDFEKILRLKVIKKNNNKQHKNLELRNLENYFNQMSSINNNGIYIVDYISVDDIMKKTADNSGKVNYYKFTKSDHKNASLLCQMAIDLLLDIDLRNTSEKITAQILQKEIAFCPFWLINLALGCTDHIFALSFLQDFFNNQTSYRQKLKKFFMSAPSHKNVYFIDNILNIPDKHKCFFELIKDLFLSVKSSSFMILKYNKKVHNTINTDNIDSGKILSLADNFYRETKFFHAIYYYNNYLESGLNFDVLHHFNYADCLNHCDTMAKAQCEFIKVKELGSSNQTKYSKIIMEAETELFNIRFWRFDVKNLVSDIDSFVEHNKSMLEKIEHNNRDLYAYYNALNRKMVTLYLLGDYGEAENAFDKCLHTIQETHKNYIAFAYMDSARGLYKHDINLAHQRICDALKILAELYDNKQEVRRYIECNLEKEYVEYVLDYIDGNNPDTSGIEYAVLNAKKNGFKNAIINGYLKLATCYLSQENTELTRAHLQFIEDNCDFCDDVRVKMLHNSIMSNLLLLENAISINLNSELLDYNINGRRISFNCAGDGDIILETRVW